jgi:hypothetical protein
MPTVFLVEEGAGEGVRHVIEIEGKRYAVVGEEVMDDPQVLLSELVDSREHAVALVRAKLDAVVNEVKDLKRQQFDGVIIYGCPWCR